MTHQLVYNAETECYEIGDWDLHCGDCFEVLINDDKERWVRTSMEMHRSELKDQDEWYLVGIGNGVQMNNLYERNYNNADERKGKCL